MSQKFVGVRRIVSVEAHRGDQITYPMGDNPLGYIMYQSDGYVSYQIMSSERQQFAVNDRMEGTNEEYANAGKTYSGYSGTYEVHENTVIHNVGGFFPNQIDKQLIRHF
jgi:hypothetical protein